MFRAASVSLACITVVALLPACSPRDAAAPDAPQSATSVESVLPADPEYAQRFGQGEAIAEAVCSQCHAIGAVGDSPHADAPPFRTLSAKYPIESLAEPLAEGIMVGHPDMPEFQFEAQQVDALLTYIESVQPEG